MHQGKCILPAPLLPVFLRSEGFRNDPVGQLARSAFDNHVCNSCYVYDELTLKVKGIHFQNAK